MGKARVKVPKTAKVGEIVTIKTMIKHKMHTGLRKNKKTGKIIPRKIINSFSAKFNGQEVFGATIYPTTSANPYFAFDFKVPGPGKMVFTWVEDGGAVTTVERSIKVS